MIEQCYNNLKYWTSRRQVSERRASSTGLKDQKSLIDQLQRNLEEEIEAKVLDIVIIRTLHRPFGTFIYFDSRNTSLFYRIHYYKCCLNVPQHYKFLEYSANTVISL